MQNKKYILQNIDALVFQIEKLTWKFAKHGAKNAVKTASAQALKAHFKAYYY